MKYIVYRFLVCRFKTLAFLLALCPASFFAYGLSDTSIIAKENPIIDFKGKSYFIYHNGGINTEGGSFRRSVCIDYLYYNTDGSIKRIVMTTEGVAAAK